MVGLWWVEKAERSEQTEEILQFLLYEYRRIFGTWVMHNEDCLVYNDPAASCPRFIHSTPYRIRLSQSSLGYWCQTVYQLSHEMCHYAIHQTKKDKTFILSWFEETVCEAVSLYALEYAEREWYRCRLSGIAPDFHIHFGNYREQLLADLPTNGMARCNTVDRLRDYEQRKVAESDRAAHVRERNLLYRAISQSPLALRYVLDYTCYLRGDGVTIDFDGWMRDNPCNFVRQLREIQPVKY